MGPKANYFKTLIIVVFIIVSLFFLNKKILFLDKEVGELIFRGTEVNQKI